MPSFNFYDSELILWFNGNHVTISYELRETCNLFEKIEHEINYMKCIILKNNSIKYIEKHDSEEYTNEYNISKKTL